MLHKVLREGAAREKVVYYKNAKAALKNVDKPFTLKDSYFYNKRGPKRIVWGSRSGEDGPSHHSTWKGWASRRSGVNTQKEYLNNALPFSKCIIHSLNKYFPKATWVSEATSATKQICPDAGCTGCAVWGFVPLTSFPCHSSCQTNITIWGRGQMVT